MKIGIVCANGKQGRELTKQALQRGHDVTVYVRKENKTEANKAVIKDLFELTREDFTGVDAVLDAFGSAPGEDPSSHAKSLLHLADCLSGTDARLLVVGGAGSLYIDPLHTLCLKDTVEFPSEYKAVSEAMKASLDQLRKREDVRWTYICPAEEFLPDGEKRGEYALTGEEFAVDKEGRSAISYADYAAAMLDEAERGDHIRQRIGVYYA